MTSPVRVARCACGQISATCRGEPLLVSLCHCFECQRRTGSTYGIAAFFPVGDVDLSGTATRYARAGDSGHDVVHYFCPQCGSTVYWEPMKKPGIIAVAVGAFADPGFPAPSQSVYQDRRHDWVIDQLSAKP